MSHEQSQTQTDKQMNQKPNAAWKGEARRRMLCEIFRESVANCSAHAISRVAPAERDLKLRIMWLLIFLCFLGITFSSSITYVLRLRSPNVKSVMEAGKVNFEFPDLYFCNSLQAAGSFTFLLNKSEADQVKIPFFVAKARFNAALKYMNATPVEEQVLRTAELLSWIQSLPYKVLADIVGQRRLQTFYRNYGIFSAGTEASLNQPVKIETLYHPNHLKCFKVALTDSEFNRMRYTNNRLQFNLLLDPYFQDFEQFWLYSIKDFRLPTEYTITSTGRNISIYPFDWNLEDPLGIDRGSGMYLYLTPRGQFPSRFTTNMISLAPGRAYDIAIRMRDSQMTPSDFPDKCVEHQEDIKFFNPYSGNADVFSYSEALCYYTEMANDMLQRYNCSLTPQPMPWQFRHLPLCLNLTAADSVDAIVRNMRAAVAGSLAAKNESSRNWDQLCSNKRLCLRRWYEVTSSYGMWPNEASLIRLVSNVLASLLNMVDHNEFRSLITGVDSLRYLSASSIESIIGYEEGISRYFKRSSLRVTLRAEDSHSTLTTFSLDYHFSKFVADIGSSLGLYLGCSLLTVLELLELLHNFLRRDK